MKKSNSTKQALLLSIVSLCLCVAMLAGTTFAWFTDSVKSESNIITAGNLDIELYWSKTAEDSSWQKVGEKTNIFEKDALWEPGKTEVVYLKVVNKGSLALKYQLGVNIAEEIEGVNKDGKTFKLSDFIKFGVVETAEKNYYGTREDALKAVEDDLKIISAGYFNSSVLYPEKNMPKPEEVANARYEEYATLVVTMPEDVNNDANHNGEDVPSIKLGLNLLATQLSYEGDSYGDDYDENASYPGEANTVEELIAALTAGQNVKLGKDIDLSGSTWTPIATYSGVFDGNGHTISNLKGENGLFDNLSGATVKNLTLENVDIDATSNHTGAVAGYINKSQGQQTVIENVTVSGTVNGGSYYVGGLIGADSNYDTVIRDCTNNATVVAPGQQVGGIVGYATRGTVVESCVNNGDITGASFVGGIIGMAAGDDEMPELFTMVKDCTNTGAVAETALDPSVTWQGGVGGIIGNIGRAANDSAVKELKFYIIDCTVADGQAVYGQKHNVLGGHENLLTVYVGTEFAPGTTTAIMDALKTMAVNESKTFFLTDGEYNGDMEITRAVLGGDRTGDLTFVAVPGTNPVLTGKATLATRGAGVEAGLNCNIIFDGITFEQANKEVVSVYIQDIKSLTMKNCTLISGGEYVLDSKSGNSTGASRIENCIFKNAKMQVYGKFGTGLVIDGCSFINSAINVAAGAGAGTTVQNCTFDYTLTDANVDDSFYLVRGSNNGNGIPVTIKNCDIKIDSALTEVAQNQEKWGALWNRGTQTAWTIENVDFTVTDAANQQTELELIKTDGGVMNTTNVTVNGTAYTG